MKEPGRLAAPWMAWSFLPVKATASCVILLMLTSFPSLAKKQPPVTKSISGAVLDAANHGIPGASVLLTDSEAHRTEAIYSGARGSYQFSGLDPNHDYQVQARYKGMASEVRGVSSFDTRTVVVINLVLAPPSSPGRQ